MFTQDDENFPAEISNRRLDDDLAVSWHHNIETVPTLLIVRNGEETNRTVGWSRAQWEQLSGVSKLGVDLPDQRPGCGSLSVDPTLSAELDPVRRSNSDRN
mgnify:CR=1 FL=1